MTCPNLKHLDLRKVTPEMRETGGVPTGGAIKDGKSKTDEKQSDNVSTDISPDKQTAATMLQQ